MLVMLVLSHSTINIETSKKTVDSSYILISKLSAADALSINKLSDTCWRGGMCCVAVVITDPTPELIAPTDEKIALVVGKLGRRLLSLLLLPSQIAA